MQDVNDWLFEIIWDLSDKAQEARMPVLAEKLEEAMDTYLAESRSDGPRPVQFQSRRYSDTDDGIMHRARRKNRSVGAINSILSGARARAGIRQRKSAAPGFNRLMASSQLEGVRFAWPL